MLKFNSGNVDHVPLKPHRYNVEVHFAAFVPESSKEVRLATSFKESELCICLFCQSHLLVTALFQRKCVPRSPNLTVFSQKF